MPTSKKKTPKKKAPKTTVKKPAGQKLSEKVLASNYFSDQQEQNKKIHKNKPRPKKPKKRKKGLKGFKHRIAGRLKRGLSHFRRERARKKDLKIKKQAAYLSNLPDTRLRRFSHKLHPKKIFGFIFSLRGLIFGVKIAVILAILGATVLAVLYLNYRRDVPTSIASLQSCIEGQTTKYYDRTGEILLWSSKSDFDCHPIQLHEVSRHLIDALITTEDKDFYNHRGFEIKAILRASYNNIRKKKTQGGSTITQQYIKNAILQDSSRTFDRKIKELILAVELERTFDKDEILTAYLNTISFGSIYSGVEAASQGYFNKSAKDLTLDEATLLVAALPAPTSFWNDPDLHVNRQRSILTQMLNVGQITQKEYDEATAIDTLTKVKVSHEQYENIKAPHFVLETEKRLTEELCGLQQNEDPEENCENIRLRGYKIITTLDMKTQALAERTVDKVIPTIVDLGFDNAVLVAVDTQTGKIIAQVGSRDFKYEGFGQTNTVTQQRDPGSTFKIFDYGTLIENSSDWGSGSIFYDYETTFENRENWTPDNYDGRHAGPITMRKALGRSLNIPAVKAMHIAGIDTVHNFARNAGIKTKFPCKGGCGLASAFGAGVESRLDELTNAYATFSRGGVHMPLTYIDRVFDSEGQLLRQWKQQPERVFKAETAYLLNHILADQSVRYTTAYNLDPNLDTVMALKTGTDDDYKNNHIMGYTKAVAMGAWIGHHDESKDFEGINTTAPKALIIKTFMEAYHQDIAYEKRNHWSRPAGIKKVKIDLLTGYQVSEDTEDEEEENRRFNRVDIFPSWYTPKISTEEDKDIKIDIVSGKIATQCTPLQAVKEVSAVKIKTEISIDDPFYDQWQEPILAGLIENLEIYTYTGDRDTVHKCDDQSPKIKIINQPESCSSVCSIEIEVRAGTFDLQQVNIIHNNQILEEGSIPVNGRAKVFTYNYRPSSVDSPREFRGALTIEVIDEGLYDNQTNVFLQISGFPYPKLPQEGGINLTSAVIDQPNQLLKVSWNKSAYNLELHFGSECSSETPVYIDNEATEIEISIQNFPSGECEIFIIDGNNEESNRLKFNLSQRRIF